MKKFNLEVCEVTNQTLLFNAGLRVCDIGKFGVREKGFKRVIEICETEEAANDVIESIYQSLES